MKVLLINPKTDRPEISFPLEGLIAKYRALLYRLPVGLAYISSSLRKAGASVKFIDFEVNPRARQELDDCLKQWSPEFIGFSIHSLGVKSAFELAKYIRSRDSSISLVAGGIQPTVFPETFLDNREFDYVIRGDGEIPFVNWISGLALDEIKGLCYFEKDTGNFISKMVNYEPFDLEKLPFPDYDTIAFDKYKSPPGGIFKLPSYPVLATRGCGSLCTFCTSYQYNKKHRVRQPEDIVAELDNAIVDYRIKEVRFLDACFTYNREHTYDLCNLLVKSKLPLVWHCWTWINGLDIDLLDLMKRAGCVGIGFGLESANQDLLKKVKKPYSLEKAVSLLDHCDRIGLFIKHSFMYGLPGETKETLEQTLDLALKLPGDIAAFNRLNLSSMLSIGSGTPLEQEYRELEHKGRKKDLVSLFPQVSDRRIQAHFTKSYFRFYFRPCLWFRNLRRKINWIFIYYNLLNAFSLVFSFFYDLVFSRIFKRGGK